MKENTPKVLIVDDVDTNRFVLKDIISDMGYQPILTENGEQALKIVQKFQVKLIISDIAMPVMDGYEFCEKMKSDPETRGIPIIFISAFDDPTDVVKGFQLGGADYITKPFVPEVVKARVELHMNLVENNRNMAELNRKLQTALQEQRIQLEREKRGILFALLRVARENAAYDVKHMERLSQNCRLLAEAMQLSPQFDTVISDSFVETIAEAAPLCDLGNIAIPTDVLQKEGNLNEEETSTMHSHTSIGARILADIEDDSDYNGSLEMAEYIAHYHHENWNGTGYPENLQGDEIPLEAQIVAVAGAFCSLTEWRTFRSAYSRESALDIMRKEAGIKYNPHIYEILFKISRQLV